MYNIENTHGYSQTRDNFYFSLKKFIFFIFLSLDLRKKRESHQEMMEDRENCQLSRF
jgi:hypothetical protein